MADEREYTNVYHNASTPPKETEPPELQAFFDATDRVLSRAAELARVVTHAHQGAAAQIVGGDWSHARKYFSLSERYSAWADYRTPAIGFGIHGYALHLHKPLRLTQAELEAHPEWRGFGRERDHHPPMRGWLVAPLIGSDGLNYGIIQVSDRGQGDFNEEDEANLVRLADLTATALDALAAVHIPDYRNKLAAIGREPGTPA